MFSGYGQRASVSQDILTAIEVYMEEELQRDRALDNISEWDQGDVHRLVSAFLGVRFPMALALNKADLPSSQSFVSRIQDTLPIHGAHVAVALAAKEEMMFVKKHMTGLVEESQKLSIPSGVWNCLTSALCLQEPILVFPVKDMATYAPLPGLNQLAAESSSLPTHGMIQCISAGNGSLPSCWKDTSYVVPSKSDTTKLRDVLIMKPGSTVEDVFLSLKNLRAMGGEFVRAECAMHVGEPPKPVPKHQILGRENRILKIMSNKRSSWQ